MDHGREYWFNQSLEQQIKDISLEFWRLTKSKTRSTRVVNLFMNRCIKYTGFSIEDPKNYRYKKKLESVLETEKKFKSDPNNKSLEMEIENFFKEKEKPKENELSILYDFFEVIDANTPNSRISIIQYDDFDHAIGLRTGTFEEVFSAIANPLQYYYRVAVFNQKTVRERIHEEHFGVKTSCVGGLTFDLEEAVHRYLNHQVKEYTKGDKQNFFYTLCHVEWYLRLLLKLNSLSKEMFESQLDKLQSGFDKLYSVTDLRTLRKTPGIYVLVLDNYHAFYVGQSSDITRRIMGHWARSNYFTGTGIDLFKPNDTTRIFAYPCEEKEINQVEYKMLDAIDPNYTLNVMTGGTIDYHISNCIPIMKTDKTEEIIFEEIIHSHKTAVDMERLFVLD